MLNAGDVLDNWEIISKLGEGGMGAVYRARNRIVGEMQAAIKVSRPTDFKQARARFEREVMALLRLQHPAVVRIQGVGEDAERGMLWFAMDLVEGLPLEDVLDRGPMPLTQALPMFIALCDGLAHAHARGVAHRDLKPANIIVRSTGEPVLVDFGISAAIDADKLTKTGMVVGTPQYLPPEALEGMIGDPSVGDIYAIGQMMVEAIDGEAAFPFNPNMTSTQNALRIMHNKVATGPLSPKMHVAPALRDILCRSTDPDPSTRLQSIAELADALRDVAAKQNITVWVQTTPSRTPASGTPFKSASATPAPTPSGGTPAAAAPAVGTAMPTMSLPTHETGSEEPPPKKRRGLGLLLAGAGGAAVLALGAVALVAVAAAAIVVVVMYLPPVPSDDTGALTGAIDPDTSPEIVDTDVETTDDPDGVAAVGVGQGGDGSNHGGTPEGGQGGSSTDVDPDTVDVEPDTEPDVEPDTEPDVEPDTEPDVEPDTEPDVEPDTEPSVDPDTEATPDAGGGDDGGGTTEGDGGGSAPAVGRIRPDWSSVLGITKGMSDSQLKSLLGPAKGGSGRYCRSGEGAKSFRNGSITVCRAIVGGAKRVFVSKEVKSNMQGLPSDPKLAILGAKKATAIALIGAPGADTGDHLRYNYGYAKLYMGGDQVIGLYVEL